jgi:hypothetical protein
MFGIFRLFLIAMIAIGILLIYGGHRNADLRDHGKIAQAEITNLKWKKEKTTRRDGGYTAKVKFTTESGREIHAEVSISDKFGRALRNRDTRPVMTVRYLPKSPTTLQDVNVEDSSDAQSEVGRYMLLAGIVMLLLGFFFKRK